AKRSLPRLVLVRVAMAYSLGSDGLEIGQVQAVEEAEAYLRGVTERLAGRGVTAETAVPYGNAAEMILTEAHIHNPDLIIMGTHGRTGLGRLLLGSVADQVMRRANAPVLLVPARCLPFEADKPDRPRVLVPVDGSEAS